MTNELSKKLKKLYNLKAKLEDKIKLADKSTLSSIKPDYYDVCDKIESIEIKLQTDEIVTIQNEALAEYENMSRNEICADADSCFQY